MEYWMIGLCNVILTGVATIVCLDTTSISVHSTGRLLCNHNVSTNEFHRVKWYQSRHDDVFEYSDLALVSWDNTSQAILTNNYGIDKDFSLVIYNTSIQDEGLYRCHITRNVLPISKTYDVKLIVYALPWKAPLIQLVNQTFITCSVDYVYPLLYPHVEFEPEEYAVQNTDGTYNTSVSGSVQDIPSESKVVFCSFPHFNYSHVSSLSLYPTTTTYGKDDEQYPTTLSGLATTLDYPSPRANNTSLVLIILAVAAVFFFFASVGLLLWRRYNSRRFPSSVKSTPVEKNGMLHTSAAGFAA